jgi:hypothetical protein
MTEVLDPTATSPVRAAVADLRATLTRLAAADLDTVTADDLLELVGEMRTARSQADAVTMRLLHTLDRQAICLERGNTSTAAWLRWAHHLHPGEATRTVRTARALHEDPPAPWSPPTTTSPAPANSCATPSPPATSPPSTCTSSST